MYILALVSGFLVPWYVIRFPLLGVPTNLWEVACAILLLGWLLIRRLEGVRDFWRVICREWVFGAFGGIGLVGVVSSAQIIDSLGIWKSFFLVPVIAALLMRVDIRVRLGLLSGMVFSGMVMSLVSVYQVLAGASRPTAWFALGVDQNLSTGGFANYIGLYLVPLVFISLLSPILPSRGALKRLGTPLLVIGILASQSYMAVGVLGLGLFLWWLRGAVSGGTFSWGRLVVWSIGVAIVIMGFASWQVGTEKFSRLWDMSERNSISARLQIWHTSWELGRDNWFWGIGNGDFQSLYAEVVPNLYFPPFEWLVPEPHSIYFAFWLHLGVFGVGLLLWFLWVGLRVWFSERWRFSIPLLMLFVYGFVDTPFWKNDLAVLWMACLVLALMQLPHRVRVGINDLGFSD